MEWEKGKEGKSLTAKLITRDGGRMLMLLPPVSLSLWLVFRPHTPQAVTPQLPPSTPGDPGSLASLQPPPSDSVWFTVPVAPELGRRQSHPW